MDISYILNELGEERENYFNAVSPPIIQSSNFAFKTVKEFRAALADEFYYDLYSRGNNPTLNILRKKLRHLTVQKMPWFSAVVLPTCISADAGFFAAAKARPCRVG